MTLSTVLAVVAIIGLIGCAFGWRRSARRLARVEGRVSALERELHDDVRVELDRAARDSEHAVVAAREAARAAGIEEPPPRLAAEAVTGPVVRAVAFSAGARRAVARFTADVAPFGKTRRAVTGVVRTRNGARRANINERRNGTEPASEAR